MQKIQELVMQRITVRYKFRFQFFIQGFKVNTGGFYSNEHATATNSSILSKNISVSLNNGQLHSEDEQDEQSDDQSISNTVTSEF